MTQTNAPKMADVIAKLRKRLAKMPAGAPLPPVAHMARQLATTRVTLGRVYEQLEATGELDRQPRRGVYVADRTQSGEFGIIGRSRDFEGRTTPYYQRACMMLLEELTARNERWGTRLLVVPGDVVTIDSTTQTSLSDPATVARLRGVFTFVSLGDLEATLEDAGVHIVGIMKHVCKHRVYFDEADYANRAIAHVKQRGVRRVAVIGSQPTAPLLCEAAHRAGLEVADDHVVCVEPSGPHEQWAFEAFCRIWRDTPARPDVVIAGQDVLCRGIIWAVMHLGLRMPEDVKLFSFAVRDIPLPYHRCVSRVEFDPREQVRRAVDMMVAQLSGESVDPESVLVRGELIEGETL